METEELKDLEKTELHKIWINAFNVVPKIPDSKFIEDLGKMVYENLREELMQSQKKGIYPYKRLILFTIS